MHQDDCSFMWHQIVLLSTLLWWIFKNVLWMIMKGYSHSFRITHHKSMCSKHSDFPAYTDWTELWTFWLSGLYWLNWTLNILTFRPTLTELNSEHSDFPAYTDWTELWTFWLSGLYWLNWTLNILTFRPILTELNSEHSDFPAYTDWTELWTFWLSGLYWLNWTLNILTFQPILETLHWLPVTHRIQYTFQLSASVPSLEQPFFMSDLLQPYSYTPARQLRSASNTWTIVTPCINTTNICHLVKDHLLALAHLFGAIDDFQK